LALNAPTLRNLGLALYVILAVVTAFAALFGTVV
jgi:hypothetical protein